MIKTNSILQHLLLFSTLFALFNFFLYFTRYFQTPLDHFSHPFKSDDEPVLNIKYLISTKYWNNDKDDPIFFYTGNEGKIELFCENSGYMWQLAQEFNALVVCAEHRYYGSSFPHAYNTSQENFSFLSSAQALADFALLITELRQNMSISEKSRVVAFGGSYGGMLAAWMRVKYPHIVSGAIAASAPVRMFGKTVPCNDYFDLTSQVFANASVHCFEDIKRFWHALKDVILDKSRNGSEVVKNTFKLCTYSDFSVPKNLNDLFAWLLDSFVSLAMANYPYPANFLAEMPTWPVNKFCAHLSASKVDSSLELITRVAQSLNNIYFNFTGSLECNDVNPDTSSSKDRLGGRGWAYQSCTEMVMPVCSISSAKNMFYEDKWNLTKVKATCKSLFGVEPRPNWPIINYGVFKDNSSMISNIVFSNGNIDPWSVGGVHETLSESVIAVLIKNGAHHLDLRASNPADPESVLKARQIEKEAIKKWLS